jgi:ribonuclease III
MDREGPPLKLAPEEKKRFHQVEKSVGYSFKKVGLLKRALTHKSYANENKLPAEEQNERLEFLGDAVLELAVSELLMEKYPSYSEGDLSKLRAAVVNEKQLASFARAFGLGDKLYLGKGEEQTSGREKPSLLADAVEAVLGAIYLDRGFDKAKQVIHKHYSKLLDQSADGELYKDYKTELQEKSQGLYRSIPRYRLAAETGPDHDKTFEVELTIRGELMGRGTGRSKKDAEQQAAKEALQKIHA